MLNVKERGKPYRSLYISVGDIQYFVCFYDDHSGMNVDIIVFNLDGTFVKNLGNFFKKDDRGIKDSIDKFRSEIDSEQLALKEVEERRRKAIELKKAGDAKTLKIAYNSRKQRQQSFMLSAISKRLRKGK